MNILYISYDGALDSLGQSQVIPYLKGLSSKSVKIILLTFEKKVALKDKYKIEMLKKELSDSLIEWKYLTYHKKPSVPATFYDILQGVFICLWVIKKEKVDIVHGRSFIGAIIALFLKKLFNIKFLLDIRGFWADERVDGNIFFKNSLLYKISSYIEKILLLNADEVVVLTRNAKKTVEGFDYLKNKKVNINVIPTCVDIHAFGIRKEVNGNSLNRTELNNKFVISYIGSVSTWYMPGEMLNFFKIIQNMIDNSHLLILTKEDKFLENILQRNSRNNISIMSVAHNLVPQYLSISKFGLAFYKPGYSRRACSPTKLGEYLACGLPVIINTGIGDCDEIVLNEKVGVVINEFSSREYERAIQKLNGLLFEGDALRERCRTVAEKYFSLDMGVDRYFEIYKRFERGLQ